MFYKYAPFFVVMWSLGAPLTDVVSGPNACNLEKRVPRPTKIFNIRRALKACNVIPFAIIGSGPAGLSAALYGARSALYTVVFEGDMPGGLLTQTTYVENWPGIPKALGIDIIEGLKKQALNAGAVCIADAIVDVDFSQWPFRLRTKSGDEVRALTVLISTGARPCFLNDSRHVPGEWEYIGRGVSTCAVCDASFYKGATVAVVGGGDSAVEEAIYLSSYADSVFLLVRGTSLRATAVMQARLRSVDKIKVLYTTQVMEIVGDDSVVTGARVINTTTGEEADIPLEGIFLAIGHSPNSSLFKPWGITDEAGYIVVGPYHQRTSIPGVFAAGDVADRFYRQAGVAAGDGIKAALDAYSFLQACGYNQALAQQVGGQHYIPYQEN